MDSTEIDVISDFKQLISFLSGLQNKCQNIQDKIKQQNEDFLKLSDENAHLKAKLNTLPELENKINSLTLECNKIDELKKYIQVLEEENVNFKKVSQIIAYEKENAKLKQLVKELQAKCTIVENNKNNNIASSCKNDKEESDEDNDKNIDVNNSDVDDTNNNAEFSVYEKKINKKVYYVSFDEKPRIFIKLEDGEIGDEVGYLINVNGKSKPVWL